MNYERWIPLIYLVFGAAILVNGLFSFQTDGTTFETVLLIVGGGGLIVVTAPAHFRSDWWSLSDSLARPMFYVSLLALVLYLVGSVGLAIN